VSSIFIADLHNLQYRLWLDKISGDRSHEQSALHIKTLSFANSFDISTLEEKTVENTTPTFLFGLVSVKKG
jgi:hypothetical protein